MDEAAAVEARATAWMDAWIAGDHATLEDTLAPQFTLRSIATDALVDRDGWLEQARSGRVAATAFDWREQRTRVLGDLAIMDARVAMTSSIEGRDWSADVYVTDVWQRQDGTWRVVARHASRPVGHAGPMRA